MDLIEHYIEKECIELTEDQKATALATYQALIINDIDNLTNDQLCNVFIARKEKRRETTRVRTLAECSICGNIRSSERRKFGDHIRMHIRKERSKVLEFITIYNERQVAVAVNRIVSPTEEPEMVIETTKFGDTPSYSSSHRHFHLDWLVMWAANNNFDASLICSNSFHDFTMPLSSHLPAITATRFTRNWLPEVTDRMMNFIYSRFWNHKVRLLVECSKRQRGTIYNFYITGDMDTSKVLQPLGSETFLVKRVTVPEETSVDISHLIANTILELSQKNIEVISFSIDSCKLCKLTLKTVRSRVDNSIDSVISASHILSGVLREVIHREPSIKLVWDQVRRINNLIQSSPYLMEVALKYRESYPYEEILWQNEWSWPYLKEKLGGDVLQYQDPSILERLMGVTETVSLNMSLFDNEEICSKLIELGSSNFLIQYKKSRWYSAWVVMKRVWSLYPALKAMEEMSDSWDHHKENAMQFIQIMQGLDRTMLERVLNYLLPLVQGIVYCQQDHAGYVDVVSLLSSLRNYYLNDATFFPVTLDVQKDCLDDSLNCMIGVPAPLVELFYGMATNTPATTTLPAYESLLSNAQEVIKQHMLSESCGNFFAMRKQTELHEMIATIPNEVSHYVNSAKDRETLSVRHYLNTTTWKYPVLYQVYCDFFCNTTTTPAIERSMVMHGVASIPTRSHMDDMTANTLLLLRTNYQQLLDHHLLEEFRESLEDGVRKRPYPSGGHAEYFQL